MSGSYIFRVFLNDLKGFQHCSDLYRQETENGEKLNFDNLDKKQILFTFFYLNAHEYGRNLSLISSLYLIVCVRQKRRLDGSLDFFVLNIIDNDEASISFHQVFTQFVIELKSTGL